MKYLFTYLFLILFVFTGISQNDHEFVSITEKVTGKRVELFAVNTNDISYDIFLMVNTKDFRRSSSRPVLKTIPANSKVKMITMVKLNGKEGKYNYTLVVNEVSYDLTIIKDHENFELKIDDEIKKKKVSIFTKDSCDLCKDTKGILSTNLIKYEEFNIDRDTIQLIKLIKEYKSSGIDERTYAPIIKIDDSLYTKIKTRKDLIEALKNHF